MVEVSKFKKFWDSADIDSTSFYFIAEIGNNHNGDMELAKRLVDIAADAGADCVKFQMRDMGSLYRIGTNEAEDLGVEYTKDLLKKFNLNFKQHRELCLYARAKSIDYLCTPWDLKSVDILEQFNVPAYKVASADFTNLPLLSALLVTGKPLILSTGMTTDNDIDQVLSFISEHIEFVALLHCNSTYPAPFEDINLAQLESLKKRTKIVGYSGHERGTAVSLAAYSLGARIIERHITIDRNMEGPDHAASLEPKELIQLLTGLYEIKSALGKSVPRALSQGEMINRENLGKSLVAARTINPGDVILDTDVSVVSPGRGLSPLRMDELIGRPTKRAIAVGEFFEEQDVSESLNALRSEYTIMGNWGIPVRYHDYAFFRGKLNPRMWEFHLSYKDLEQDVSILNYKKSDSELIVHAPELFSDSHLLDLTSNNFAYRAISLRNMRKVIEQAKLLGKYFNQSRPIKIVTNVGGFSMDKPLEEKERLERYEIFSDSLHSLSDPDVEILPQTMAPFPWHFGGQRYQNIFLDADEMKIWCNKLSLRLCLDTSHSKLYCNHAGKSFPQFIKKLLPLTAHIHLGDAKSLNGEGLQIGEGEIDFDDLFRSLKEAGYQHSILPEIWQGHKNSGYGFAVALEKMENLTIAAH